MLPRCPGTKMTSMTLGLKPCPSSLEPNSMTPPDFHPRSRTPNSFLTRASRALGFSKLLEVGWTMESIASHRFHIKMLFLTLSTMLWLRRSLLEESAKRRRRS